MRIGILKAGETNAGMLPAHATYSEIFDRFFTSEPAFDRFTITVIDVMGGELPADIHDYDGYLVTGSATGVYDDEPWIAPLGAFLRAAHAARIPLAGICFGHQMLAHSLGGHAEKFDGGWGLGVRDVPLANKPAWLDDRDSIRLIHIHQDQVMRLPDGATLIGSTDFCHNAMYHVDDIVFSMQGHPEFTLDYTEDLLDLRRDLMGPDRVDAARDTYAGGHDGPTLTRWFYDFFAQHAPAQGAAQSDNR